MENCKHRLYPNNIFSLCFSFWSFFLLNNNIGDCIQCTSGLFPNSQRGSLRHAEIIVPPVWKSMQARRNRDTHLWGGGDHTSQEGPQQAGPLPLDRCRSCWPPEVQRCSQTIPVLLPNLTGELPIEIPRALLLLEGFASRKTHGLLLFHKSPQQKRELVP